MTCKMSYLIIIYLQGKILSFLLRAYKRNANARICTFSIFDETECLKPNEKHTKLSNPYVKHEKNETKSLGHYVKQDFHFLKVYIYIYIYVFTDKVAVQNGCVFTYKIRQQNSMSLRS